MAMHCICFGGKVDRRIHIRDRNLLLDGNLVLKTGNPSQKTGKLDRNVADT